RPGNGSAPSGTGTFSPGNVSACDHLWRDLRGAAAPTEVSLWLRVLLYMLIFTLSVVGNGVVVAVLGLSRRLRTVTNSFLLSLALSDLLLALCCMPFTLVPNLMGTFVFGEVVCKLMAYLMGVSVSVSTFSLVAIALERYSAICKPLQSRAWQTRAHACRVIAGTWLLSALLMLPYAIYSTTRAGPAHTTRCIHDWPSQGFRQGWYVLLLVVLFFVPGVVMAVAYGLISRELYRGIRFELDIKGELAAPRTSHGDPPPPPAAPACDQGDGCYLQLSRPAGALELRPLGARARVNTSRAKLEAKQRVIRMLVVIVAMFFLCWLPIFTANTWRAFAPREAQRLLSGTPISFIHLLSYTSACANPLIYCFMNRRFRRAFLASCLASCLPTCPCSCPGGCTARAHPPRSLPDEEVPTATTNASISKFSYSTVSSLG
ncbi:CCKAR protein, partial [Galbula dea]|nr:CCKAR protein [Galbula dea]